MPVDQQENVGADLDPVAVAQGAPTLDGLAVDPDPVEGRLGRELDSFGRAVEDGMPARRQAIVEHHVTGLVPPHDELACLRERDLSIPHSEPKPGHAAVAI
jgi:hypothetical protein